MKTVYVTVKDGEIYSFTNANNRESALYSCEDVGADMVIGIDEDTLKRLTEKYNDTSITCGSCEEESKKATENNECPHCGSGNWVYGTL